MKPTPNQLNESQVNELASAHAIQNRDVTQLVYNLEDTNQIKYLNRISGLGMERCFIVITDLDQEKTSKKIRKILELDKMKDERNFKNYITTMDIGNDYYGIIADGFRHDVGNYEIITSTKKAHDYLKQNGIRHKTMPNPLTANKEQKSKIVEVLSQ